MAEALHYSNIGSERSSMKLLALLNSGGSAVRIVVATLAGTVAYFLFGWLVFEWILGDYMAGHTTQIQGFKKSDAEASMLMLVVSCAAYALLLAIEFERWAHVRTMKAGITLGAIIGTLVALMTNAYWYSTSHFFNDLVPLVVDIAAAVVTVGMMGRVIGWTLGNFKTRT